MNEHSAARVRRPGRHRARRVPVRVLPARLFPGLVPAVVACLVAGLALLGTATAVAPAAAASLSAYQGSPAMAPSTYERRVEYWINKRRSQHGLHRLRLASCTDQAAERWGRHLALTDDFYHQSMMDILVRCNAYYAGETLGRGAITPKRLVYLWMHSPEHREVLLSPHARRIGVGCFPDRYGRWVTAVDYMHF